MRQLVGLTCALCEKSIGSILEGQFCSSCQCPVHKRCLGRTDRAVQPEGCAVCGASPQKIDEEEQADNQEKVERAELEGVMGPGVRASTSEWTVMLALAKTFYNPFAMRLREDIGQLEWRPGQVTIIGRRAHRFNHVVSLALVRQPISWFGMVVASAAVLGFSFGGCYTALAPENPLTWIALVSMNLLWIGSTLTTRWVEVTYKSGPGKEETLYLLPVTPGGWRRFDGASECLLETLEIGVLGVRHD